MSSDTYDHSSPELLGSSSGVQEFPKKPRFSYTRDFLLSLSELDICKRLPPGFDASFLSEFEDASSNPFQHRNLGGFYSQSSRRGEYAYTQTNRTESSSNFLRGSQGKWETRSSGSSDREELQTERDSSAQDIRKHHSNQPRRSWRQTEHDGLLGKPSGYSGQDSSQRTRGSGSYMLSKSTEPYQPPRPNKSIPHSWKDNTDSINEETFGSSECSEDRAEEERKRRASFELMRKEQQQALQEKQKQTPDCHIDMDNGLFGSLKNSEDLLRSKNEDGNMATSRNDNSTSAHTQLSTSRPRVPPGFRSAAVKIVSVPSPEAALALEAGKSGSSVLPSLNKDTLLKGSLDGISEITSQENTVILTNDAQASSTAMKSAGSPSLQVSDLQQDTVGWIDTAIHSDITNTERTKSVLDVPPKKGHSSSILDKLFPNPSKQTNVKGSPNFAEQDAIKVDDESWSSSLFHSSKFSDWFLEEKKIPEEKLSSEDLLSRILNNEKAEVGELTVPDEKADENMIVFTSNIIPNVKVMESISSFKHLENVTPQKLVSVNSNIVPAPETCFSSLKVDMNLSVLTCEDLEQFILAEANATNAAKSVRPQWDSFDVKSEPSIDANDHASQHLRSLLHVGTGRRDSTSDLDGQAPESFKLFNIFGTTTPAGNNLVDCNFMEVSTSNKVHDNKNPPLLEDLFGPSFMKQLQSTDAPLSAQMSSADGDDEDAAFHPHNSLFSHSGNEVRGPISSSKGYGSVTVNEWSESSNQNAMAHTHMHQDPWTMFQASKHDGGMTAVKPDVNVSHRQMRLSEEGSLIAAGEPLSRLVPGSFSGTKTNKLDGQPSFKPLDDFDEKLTTLNSVLRNERASLPGTAGSLPVHGSFEVSKSDPPYGQFLQRQPSPPFIHQVTQSGSPFQQLDPRDLVNPHTRFLAQDNIHFDPRHQFHQNTVAPQSFNTLAQQFDPSAHLTMLQGMSGSANFPQHDLQGFSRGAVPSHQMNHMPHPLEMNPMHGFLMSHRQPNHGGLGMEMPGPRIGGGPNHPEALQRLFEMEMRAAKQNHPLAESHLHGSYGSEIGMGFGYR